MRRVVGIVVACFLLIPPLAAPVAASTTTTVDCTAGADLQTAIDAASDGDTLLIRGRCVGNFSVGKVLNLQGRGPKPTIAGGPDSTAPVLDLSTWDSGLTLTIRGLTITGGAGYGIAAVSGHLNLIGSSVTDNALTGVLVFSGTMTMDRSIVSGNGGRGLACYGDMVVEISRSVISGNAQGGIYNADRMTVTDTVVKNNTGGGIRNASSMAGRGELTVVRSLVFNNTSDESGGGIVNLWKATIIDSIVRNNTAGVYGGGVYNGKWPSPVGELVLGVITIRDSWIVRNAAGLDGGGIYSESGFNGASGLTLRSVVIWGNTPNDCVGAGC
jgi:hypothetical protein